MVDDDRSTDSTGPAHSEVRSVTRAAALLGQFTEIHPRRHIRELATLTGLPRTTVLRLLSTLESESLVAQVGEGVYQIGAGALRWLDVVQNSWRLSDEAHGVLEGLRDDTGESANVYVRQSRFRVSIGQAEGHWTVRSVVPLGAPLPIHQGASGLVLLAGLSDWTSHVEHEFASDETLGRRIATARETGYAISHGERESGASAVAAPIIRAGQVAAALSLSGPTSRFTSAVVPHHLELVRSCADRLSAQGIGPVESLLLPS
ncbi:IclR family transcriptional regulator [Aeromicrobium sp. YIM 150415]|uniref:IclR family transcriptional regulator n=1 Tax=Aeromicrobium sp. YIM 150415 TaxID=2803912 RepID=UPI001964A7F9|nr:IclR family transcriptional regulator [Aeromicrobium sp. YIM 150415]MBM9463401.1 IclR family transcriptional regulator [Aeromicrobium sp. YIM 150415]